VAVLQIRTIFVHDQMRFEGSNGDFICWSKFGVICFSYDNSPTPGSTRWFHYWKEREDEIDWQHMTTTWHSGFFENALAFDFHHLGFRIARVVYPGSWSGMWFQVPYWFLFLGLAARPGLKIFRRWRTKNPGTGSALSL